MISGTLGGRRGQLPKVILQHRSLPVLAHTPYTHTIHTHTVHTHGTHTPIIISPHPPGGVPRTKPRVFSLLGKVFND